MKTKNLLLLIFPFISFAIYSQGLKLEPKKYKADEIYKPSLERTHLPSSISLRKYCPQPLKQDSSNSVGFAIAYAALSTQYNIEKDESVSITKWATAFDPYFIYNFLKQKEGNSCQNETTLISALNILEQNGCKPRIWEPLLSCGENETFNELTLSVSLQNKIIDWKALGGDNIVSETKKALYNKLPVIIGIALTESFKNGFSIVNGSWKPLNNEKIIGGHAMCVIGFDDTKNGGSFEIMNSYGNNFGDKGFVWITYKDFVEYVEEAYVMKTHNFEKANCSFGDCLNTYSRYKFENGDVFEGIVKDSLLDFYGTMLYSNGSVYVGGWNKGQKNGSGLFYDDSIKKFFKTYFQNDLLSELTEKSFGFASEETNTENLNELTKSLPKNEILINDFETAQNVLNKYENQSIPTILNFSSKNNLIEIRKKIIPCKDSDKKGICAHDYKKSYNESVKSFNDKNYSRALTLINQSIKNAEFLGEDLNKMYYQKAQILAAKKLYSEAIDELYKMNNDKFEFYNYNLAIYQSKVGNYESAIYLYKKIINDTNKLKGESHLGLGYCYLKQNKLNDALNEFQISNKIKSNIDASIGIIKSLMQLDEREKAIKELILVQKKYSNNTQLKNYLVNCNLNDENSKGLTKNMRSIKKSKSFEALLTLGNYNFKHEKNYKDAESNYKKSKIKDKASIGLNEVSFVQKSEFKNNSLINPILNELSGIDNYNKKNYYLAFDNIMLAIQFKKGYRLSYDGLLCLANLYLKKNEIKKAQETFEAAIKRSKNNAYAHAGLGFCLSKDPFFIHNSKLYTKANFHFKNALKVEPNNSTFLFNAGATEFLMKNYFVAKQNLTDASLIDSLNPQLLNVLALTYSRLNEHKEAIKSIRKACKIDSFSSYLEINSGYIIAEKITQLIKQDSNLNVNGTLRNLNNHYDKAIMLGADPSVILTNRGYGYLMANKKDSAIILYNQIVSEDSLIIAGKNNNIGVVDALGKKSEKASNDFDKAFLLDKKEKYYFIKQNKNKILNEKYNLESDKKTEFTSLVYFYLPLIQSEPKFTGNLNIPENEIMVNISNEINEADKYKFHCSEHSKYYLVFHKPAGVNNKQVKQKNGVDGCSTPNKQK